MSSTSIAPEESGFEARAREISATNVAIIALASAAGLVLLWPSDLLVVGDDRAVLVRFACYRALAVGCCLALAWSVRRIAAVRRRPASALLLGTLATTGVTLLSLGPHATLDRGWMDLGYLLPLATSTVLIPLGRRVALTLALTGGWLAQYFACNPAELGREFLWVHLLVQGLAVGLSVYLGHTILRLLERRDEAARALEQSNRRLEDRVARREAELRRSYAHIVDTREDERLRLSRELHDATGQVLTGLRLGLGLLRRTVDPEQDQRVARLDRMLDELFAAVAQIVQDLRPAVLDDLGLLPALASLATTIRERSGLVVRVSIDGQPWAPGLASLEARGPCSSLSPAARVGLFRVAQAALGLFAGLEGASWSSLDLRATAEGLTLRVTVDATLPRPEPQSRRGSELGAELLEFDERARMLGARLKIEHEAPASVEVIGVPRVADGARR